MLVHEHSGRKKYWDIFTKVDKAMSKSADYRNGTKSFETYSIEIFYATLK